MAAHTRLRHRPVAAVMTVGCITALVHPAARATSHHPDDPWDGNWHGTVTPYAWLPGLSADTTFRLPNNGAIIHATSDSSLLSKLGGAFMLQGVARKGDWGLFADLDWVTFRDERGRFTSLGHASFRGDAGLVNRWNVKGGLVNLSGLYTLGHGDHGYADLLFGVRYLWLKGNLNWDFAATGNGGRLDIADSGHLRAQTHVSDGVIGVQGRWTPFANSAWYFPYYADVGSGDSDNTYQLIVGAGYGFHWGDVALSYRDVKYKEGARRELLRQAELGGPALSLTWHF